MEATLSPLTDSSRPATQPDATTPRATRWREPLGMWLGMHVVCVLAMYAGAAFLPATFDVQKENPRAGAIDDLPAYFREYAAHPQSFCRKPMLGIRVGGPWEWLDPLVRWDAVWYLSIAEVGYVTVPESTSQQNVAFFPLYPLLIRGLSAIGLNSILAGLLIAQVASLAASCLLYRLTQRHYGVSSARWATGLWNCFPAAMFGCVPYADSLLALLSILSLGALLDRKDVVCGWWNGLASAVRPPGLFLGISLSPGLFSRRWAAALLGGVLSALGTAAYFAYLGSVTGDPLYYLQMGALWRDDERSANPLAWGLRVLKLLAYYGRVLWRGEPTFEYRSSHVFEPFLFVWTLFYLPGVRRLGWGVLLASILPALSILPTGSLAGMMRYTWAVTPLFVVAGTSLATSRLRWPTLLVWGALLVRLAFLYGGGWEVI